MYPQETHEIPEDKRILHSCDCPACVNPSHLHIGTQSQNIQERNERGRTARGEQASKAKLTEVQVLEIRERYKNEKISFAKLGREYKVSASAISTIIKRKFWTHI